MILHLKRKLILITIILLFAITSGCIVWYQMSNNKVPVGIQKGIFYGMSPKGIQKQLGPPLRIQENVCDTGQIAYNYSQIVEGNQANVVYYFSKGTFRWLLTEVNLKILLENRTDASSLFNTLTENICKMCIRDSG